MNKAAHVEVKKRDALNAVVAGGLLGVTALFGSLVETSIIEIGKADTAISSLTAAGDLASAQQWQNYADNKRNLLIEDSICLGIAAAGTAFFGANMVRTIDAAQREGHTDTPRQP